MAEGKPLQPNNENYSKQWKQWKTYGQIDEIFLDTDSRYRFIFQHRFD